MLALKTKATLQSIKVALIWSKKGNNTIVGWQVIKVQSW